MKKLWFLLCLPALFTCGCAGLDGKRTEVLLKQGESYTILLEENPTTGYRWSIYLLDLRVVSIEEDAYIPPASEVMGAPGVRKFVVKGAYPGQGELELHYVRSWERKQEPADKRLYVFKVYR